MALTGSGRTTPVAAESPLPPQTPAAGDPPRVPATAAREAGRRRATGSAANHRAFLKRAADPRRPRARRKSPARILTPPPPNPAATTTRTAGPAIVPLPRWCRWGLAGAGRAWRRCRQPGTTPPPRFRAAAHQTAATRPPPPDRAATTTRPAATTSRASRHHVQGRRAPGAPGKPQGPETKAFLAAVRSLRQPSPARAAGDRAGHRRPPRPGCRPAPSYGVGRKPPGLPKKSSRPPPSSRAPQIHRANPPPESRSRGPGPDRRRDRAATRPQRQTEPPTRAATRPSRRPRAQGRRAPGAPENHKGLKQKLFWPPFAHFVSPRPRGLPGTAPATADRPAQGAGRRRATGSAANHRAFLKRAADPRRPRARRKSTARIRPRSPEAADQDRTGAATEPPPDRSAKPSRPPEPPPDRAAAPAPRAGAPPARRKTTRA